MVILAPLIRVFARSLVFRLVSYATMAAGAGILALILGAGTLIEWQNRLEAEGIERLAETKVSERIEAEINLVSARLRSAMMELEDSLTLVASLSSTHAAIRTMPIAELAPMLSQRLSRAGFTSGLVVKHGMLAIPLTLSAPARQDGAATLQSTELSAILSELMDNNDGASPATLRMIAPLEPELASLMNIPPELAYGYLLAVPIFDEHGDVDALLLGYRALRRNEAILNAFSNATGASIVLRHGGSIITQAGHQDGAMGIPVGDSLPMAAGSVFHQREASMVGRCAPAFAHLSICVLRPQADVIHFRDEIAAIGSKTEQTLRSALLGIAALSLFGIMAVTACLAIRLTRPLQDLTGDVSRVSAGEWPVTVQHSERADEIGRIARALVTMQSALIERDRMRQEMVRIEALNARRHVLDAALSRFETSMAGAMGNITRTMQTVGQTNSVLDRATRETAQQAESIRDASQETSTRASAVANAALHLSTSIREMDQRARSMRDGVHESEGHALLAEHQIGEVATSTRHAEEALRQIHDLVANLARLSLGVSLKSGQNVHNLAEIAQFNTIAAKAVEAAAITEAEIARLGDVAEGATLSIAEMKGGLGVALDNMAEITVILAEQGATTREMTESLGIASEALGGLADAVEKIRAAMADAQDASSDFITLARLIAQDARLVDASVRDFVKDVAA
jgi:HAMP domain-containing protein/uncharacterized protein YoxC